MVLLLLLFIRRDELSEIKFKLTLQVRSHNLLASLREVGGRSMFYSVLSEGGPNLSEGELEDFLDKAL